MTVNLTVILKSKPENREILKTLLIDLVQKSMKEVACLQYDLHQSLEDSQIFIFHEVWESEAGLKFHHEQPYIISFFEKVSILLQETPTVYRTEKL